MISRDKKITIEFRRSLAFSISIDLSLLALADEYEGFDQWIYTTYSALSGELRSSIRTLFRPFANKLLFDELIQDDVSTSIEDLPMFIRWISSLPDETVRASNLKMLQEIADGASPETGVIDARIFEDKQRLARFLHLLLASKLRRPETDRLVRYLMHPEEMKAELVLLSVRFWDRHYRTEYSRCRTLEERNLEQLKHRELPAEAREIFVELTGRSVLPDSQDRAIDEAKRLVLIPACHGGPYASISPIESTDGALVIVYNCLPAAASGKGRGLPSGELFPPLKAIADETRLDILGFLIGRELYAQQIVDQMEISQSAVSRHLRLMVACGILRERKQEGMKFYSLNGATIDRVCKQLEVLKDEPPPVEEQ